MSRIALLIGGVLLVAADASAQTIGVFRWQMRPYCNVITVTVTAKGAVYGLEGSDDQCGGGTVGTVTGLAQLNPNGTIGLGFTVVASPSGRSVQVSASIDLTTVGGTWSDSAGHTGPFVFTTGAPVAGPARPDRLAHFRVVGTGGATVGHDALALITNWTTLESNDGGGTYAPGAGTYTVPVTAVYRVDCRVGWNTFSSLAGVPRAGVFLLRNDFTFAQDFDTPSAANPFVHQVSVVQALTAGDVIRCGAFQSSGATQSIQSLSLNTSFSVTQVQ